jgi:hypothetical protein
LTLSHTSDAIIVMRRISIVIACAAGASLAVAALASACVGEDPAQVNVIADGSPPPNGGDAPGSPPPPAPAPPPGDGGTEACKTCNGSCVQIDDPAYGCAPTSCTPCPSLPNVATARCNGNACGIGTCAPAFDDLDVDSGNGCETPNPRSVQPSALAVWLSADRGVSVTADGGVTGWANQNGAADAGAGAVPESGRATVDKTSWPSKPGMPSIAFDGATSFTIDLSGMESATGYTTYVVSARYGPGVMCVMASHTYPQPFSCCPDKGKAMQLCFDTNTTLNGEVFCNTIRAAIPANAAGAYQSHLSAMWFDPAVPANYTNTNGGAATSNAGAQCPSKLSNLSNARIGGGYSGASYTGLVGEIVVYSTLLSAADRIPIESYLKTKWKTP